MANEQAQLCTSIFKNGDLSKEAYTKKWVELIRALEKTKSWEKR